MNAISTSARYCFLISVFIMPVLDGCSTKAASPNAPPPMNVGVVDVIEKDVPIYGDWVATLDGNVNANIQPQVSGYLVKQNYIEGSFVHKEDVLFEIDPRPFQTALDQTKAQLAQARGQVAQAQAQLELAEINVKRDTPLAAARAIAQSQLDNDIQAKVQAEAQGKTAEGAVQAAQAAIEQGELNLGFTRVRSLIDGIAGIAATQIGNLVGPSSILTTVSQLDPIKVYFPISEQEYLQMAKGTGGGSDLLRRNVRADLQLMLANGDAYPRRGTEAFADRQVDSQTGTIRMVGIFPNPGNILRPGQFGRIRSHIGFRKSALLVPQRAVSQLQGRYQIAVVGSDGKVNIRNVEVGERVDSLWIVTSGLKAGDKVVSEGTAKVREGMTVNPRPDKSDAEVQ
jgi:RND family efflux transporter MFP subunit